MSTSDIDALFSNMNRVTTAGNDGDSLTSVIVTVTSAIYTAEAAANVKGKYADNVHKLLTIICFRCAQYILAEGNPVIHIRLSYVLVDAYRPP